MLKSAENFLAGFFGLQWFVTLVNICSLMSLNRSG